MSCKGISRSQRFYLRFWFYTSFRQIVFFPMCQNILLITGKYLIAIGVEQALFHIPILFQQIGLPFLPFLLFLPLKEHACTHTDFIPTYYLPAVRLKCRTLKCVFFFKQQQQHLDLCNFNLGWFPSFPFWPSRHLWTSCTYTMTSNHSWKSDSLGIMNNDQLEAYKTTNCQ